MKKVSIFSILMPCLAALLLSGCGKKDIIQTIDFESAIRNEFSTNSSEDTVENDDASEPEEGENDVSDEMMDIPEMEGMDIVEIAKKGKITNTITGSFDEDYYDESSLETFLLAEISDYNRQKGAEVVKLKSAKTGKANEAKVVVEYSSPEVFADFNGQTFFYGTIEEAMVAGLDLNQSYINVKTNESVFVDEALAKEKWYIVVSKSDRDRLNICTPKKIIYTSDNVQVENSKEAVFQAGSINILICK